MDAHEPWRRISELTPYDHLKRFLRICVVHFLRNIAQLETYLTVEVLHAMRSIATADEHEDLNGTLALIRSGGSKAIGVCIFCTGIDSC